MLYSYGFYSLNRSYKTINIIVFSFVWEGACVHNYISHINNDYYYIVDYTYKSISYEVKYTKLIS